MLALRWVDRGGIDHCTVKLPYTTFTIYTILADRFYFGGFSGDPTHRSGELNMGSYLTKVIE